MILELSMFINASLPQIHYLMKRIADWDLKKNILLDTIYIVFSQKLLQMT